MRTLHRDPASQHQEQLLLSVTTLEGEPPAPAAPLAHVGAHIVLHAAPGGPHQLQGPAVKLPRHWQPWAKIKNISISIQSLSCPGLDIFYLEIYTFDVTFVFHFLAYGSTCKYELREIHFVMAHIPRSSKSDDAGNDDIQGVC